jgi:hypothetical protein
LLHFRTLSRNNKFTSQSFLQQSCEWKSQWSPDYAKSENKKSIAMKISAPALEEKQ